MEPKKQMNKHNQNRLRYREQVAAREEGAQKRREIGDGDYEV